MDSLKAHKRTDAHKSTNVHMCAPGAPGQPFAHTHAHHPIGVCVLCVCAGTLRMTAWEDRAGPFGRRIAFDLN